MKPKTALPLLISMLLVLGGCHAPSFEEGQGSVSGVDEAPARKLVEVTLTEGTNLAAAPSPDGQTIIMALQGQLWSVPGAGGKAMPLTSPELDAHEPVWSPDGQLVAFYAYAHDGFSIWTMKPDGTELEEIVDGLPDGRYPSFSPDGKSLLYASDEEGGYQVWTVSLETGERKMLTTPDETGYEVPVTPYFSGLGNAVYPTLSPDGSKLAFVIDGEKDVLVTRPIDGEASFLVVHLADTLGAPVWMPEGDQLVVAGLNGKSGHIALVSADERKAVRLVEGADVFPFRPGILPDGQILYTADGQIKTISTTGDGDTVVPFEATVTLDRTPYERRTYDLADATSQKALGIVDPSLSPDGAQVVFTALGDLWVADVEGDNLVQLTNDDFIDFSPNWSPDGEKIAFVSDRGGKSDIWTYSVSSGEMTQVSDLGAAPNVPIWSPDSSKIAYLEDVMISIFIAGKVAVLDPETGERAILTEPIFGPGPAVWSPDGSTIALTNRVPANSRFREGVNGIMLVSATEPGVAEYVLPAEGKSLGRRQWNRLAWSSDGAMVFRMDNALWVADLNPAGELGEPLKIADAGENPSWSADGTKLVYVDGEDMKVFDKATGLTSNVSARPEWQNALSDQVLTIRAGRVFDGSSATYLQDMDIIVEGGVITGIHPAGIEHEGILVDASDQTVLPGLIESHTHQSTTQGKSLGDLWLSFGITSVRETGDDPYHMIERRESVAAGRRSGPRVFAAGPLNEGARVSYGVSETTGTSELAEDALRRHGELELDFFKSYVRQDFAVQKDVIRMAHDIGIPVTSHELYPAVANNIDQLEHFGATSRRGYSLIRSRTNHSYQDVIALIGESGMYITPTLALMSRNGTEDITSVLETLKRVVDAGGNIVAGTDSPFIPHGDALHTELRLYVDAGLTPAAALKAATSDAATAIGVGDQLGKIAPGYIADILIVDGDPLNEISDTRKVKAVIQSGFVVYEAAAE